MLTVWLDAWQMECCGEPFEVGSTVSWTLLDEPDRKALAPILGPLANRVTHSEEHHGRLPQDAPSTLVRVRSIRAVRCRYATRPFGSELRPVKGSADLREVPSAKRQEENDGDLHFVGYLVEGDAL